MPLLPCAVSRCLAGLCRRRQDRAWHRRPAPVRHHQGVLPPAAHPALGHCSVVSKLRVTFLWQLRQPRPLTGAPGASCTPPASRAGAGGGEEGPETRAVPEAASPASVPYTTGHVAVLRPPVCLSVVTGPGEADGPAHPIVKDPCLLPHDLGAHRPLGTARSPAASSRGPPAAVPRPGFGSALCGLSGEAVTGAQSTVQLRPPRRAQVPRLRATCHCSSAGLLPDTHRVAVQAGPASQVPVTAGVSSSLP